MRTTTSSNVYSDAMAEAYERLDGLGYERGENDFANHGPMAAEALCTLGFGDEVASWVEHYKRRMDHHDPPESRFRIDPSDEQSWREALGRFARAGDWEELFRRNSPSGRGVTWCLPRSPGRAAGADDSRRDGAGRHADRAGPATRRVAPTVGGRHVACTRRAAGEVHPRRRRRTAEPRDRVPRRVAVVAGPVRSGGGERRRARDQVHRSLRQGERAPARPTLPRGGAGGAGPYPVRAAEHQPVRWRPCNWPCRSSWWSPACWWCSWSCYTAPRVAVCPRCSVAACSPACRGRPWWRKTSTG